MKANSTGPLEKRTNRRRFLLSGAAGAAGVFLLKFLPPVATSTGLPFLRPGVAEAICSNCNCYTYHSEFCDDSNNYCEPDNEIEEIVRYIISTPDEPNEPPCCYWFCGFLHDVTGCCY